MEMAAAWKPQNGFHTALEISHRPRDSHISTGAHRWGRDDKHGDNEDALLAEATGELYIGSATGVEGILGSLAPRRGMATMNC